MELRIPKLPEGSFFPSLLEPRRRIDRTLLAVVMEAYVHGTSTRKVDDLVKALGVDAGISKSEVSRICVELDREVAAFRSRSLAHTAFPYLFLDATYLKARVDGRVVSRTVVIATGVTANGGREVLGLDVGDSEDGAFWTAFLRSLKARGLAGVQLIVSEAHTGLKQAIGAVLGGAAWRRCRVHFHRDWIYDHDHLAPERTTEDAFDRLNPEFGVPADRSNRIGHRDVQQREAALAPGVRVAVHDSRQNDRNPVIWQPGQDYRMADALHAARAQPTRTRWGPERLGPER